MINYYGYRDRVHNNKFSKHVTVDVTEEPITLAEACAQCRQDSGVDDAYITSLISVAREYVENVTGQCMCLRTMAIAWDEFPFPFGEMVLPYGPLNSITSITYRDFSNTLITVDPASYNSDTYSPLGAAYLPILNYWPFQVCQPHSVIVTGVFGYGTVASGRIPKTLIHSIKLQLQNLYEHRKSIADGIQPYTIMHNLDAMLAQNRTSWF